MTPYEFEILLHYYTSPVDHPHALQPPPGFVCAMSKLIGLFLVGVSTDLLKPDYYISKYGREFVELCLATPIPANNPANRLLMQSQAFGCSEALVAILNISNVAIDHKNTCGTNCAVSLGGLRRAAQMLIPKVYGYEQHEAHALIERMPQF